MSKKTNSILISQLELLVEKYDIQISRPGIPTEYELTVFYSHNSHSHFGGKL